MLGLDRRPSFITLVCVYNFLREDPVKKGAPKEKMYMTSFLQHLISQGHRISPVFVDGGWLEVDTVQDLNLYEQLEAEGHLAKFCNL